MIPVFLVTAWANPIFRKVVLYAAIALAVLYAGYRWLNKHDSRIYQEGRESMAVELEKEKQAEWAEKDKLLQQKESERIKERTELTKALFAKDKNLNDTLNQLRVERERDRTVAITIPANELPAAVLSRSRNLANSPKPIY